MYRINGDRIALDLDGPRVEVEPIQSWQIRTIAAALRDVFNAAKTPSDEFDALSKFIEFFVAEAMPQWDFCDHRGAVPATSQGMARLPIRMQFDILSQWVDGPQAAELEDVRDVDAPSAVDAVIPPGEGNREIKRRLRSVKAA